MALAKYIVRELAVESLVIHGESIGGVAASRTAQQLSLSPDTRSKVALLICDRTFCNLEAVAQRLVGKLTRLEIASGVPFSFLNLLTLFSLLSRQLVWQCYPCTNATGTWKGAPHVHRAYWSSQAHCFFLRSQWNTDVAGDFLTAQCPKVVANDFADAIIADSSSLKSGIALWRELQRGLTTTKGIGWVMENPVEYRMADWENVCVLGMFLFRSAFHSLFFFPL